MRYVVYLDTCCFNRPYDDQQHPLIRIETEAKLLIQYEVMKQNIDIVWSFILHYENSDNPFADRKRQIALWEARATRSVPYSHEVQKQAQRITALGIKTKDALHIACAIAAEAKYFITTDKKLLNKRVDGIVITDPMDFVRRYFGEN